ncbi:hypothetical protein QVD17_14156 [Tagetes erecta]|uniref:Uncharacterized protein n=1 Tax=Tagetes erecta TaxID=13708 RepID=A0AAD8KYL2_TARER|nr:hypothetical protein QVD17_14156 [Tagetes erecta]
MRLVRLRLGRQQGLCHTRPSLSLHAQVHCHIHSWTWQGHRHRTFLSSVSAQTHTVSPAHGLSGYFSVYYHKHQRGVLIGGNIVSQIAIYLGYEHAISQLPTEGVAPHKANRATVVGMWIFQKLLDNQWCLVGSYDVLEP